VTYRKLQGYCARRGCDVQGFAGVTLPERGCDVHGVAGVTELGESVMYRVLQGILR